MCLHMFVSALFVPLVPFMLSVLFLCTYNQRSKVVSFVPFVCRHILKMYWHILKMSWHIFVLAQKSATVNVLSYPNYLCGALNSK